MISKFCYVQKIENHFYQCSLLTKHTHVFFCLFFSIQIQNRPIELIERLCYYYYGQPEKAIMIMMMMGRIIYSNK